MKTALGVCILIILVLASCGCTIRQANVTPTTQPAATEPVQTSVGISTETPAAPAATESLPVTTAAPATVTGAANITTAATTRPAVPPQTRVTKIHIRNNTFVPDQLTVLPGTRVTWINDDPGIHVVKSIGSAAGKFTSADLINGAEFGYTFGDATGTFEFTDPSHPEMKGAVIVRTGQTLWVATFAPTTAPA